MALAIAMIASMFTFGAMNVSATAPTGTVSYTDETLTVTGATWGSGGFTHYYALKAPAALQNTDDATNNAMAYKLKWFPVYGPLDISRLIPRAGATAAYRIALITASDYEPPYRGDDRVMTAKWQADELTIIDLVARPALARDAVKYDIQNGKLDITGGADAALYQLQVGIGAWTAGVTAMTTALPAADFLTGQTINVRLAPVTITGSEAFASAAVKVKIPAVPAAPSGFPAPAALKLSGTVRGLKAGMELVVISSATATPVWTTGVKRFADINTDGNTTITFEELFAAFSTLGTDSNDDVVVTGNKFIAVRTAATDRRPASVAGVLTVSGGTYVAD